MSNPVISLDYPTQRIAAVEKQGILARPMLRLLTDIVRRLGGQRADFVQEARATALETEAMVLAILRGVTCNFYHTPANPLTATATSATLATITIAEHTRSTAAATLEAGTVTGVTRGSVYYVYYSDAGDAGGTVTYLATTAVSGLTAAGVRLIGAIYVEPVAPTAGTEA